MGGLSKIQRKMSAQSASRENLTFGGSWVTPPRCVRRGGATPSCTPFTPHIPNPGAAVNSCTDVSQYTHLAHTCTQTCCGHAPVVPRSLKFCFAAGCVSGVCARNRLSFPWDYDSRVFGPECPNTHDQVSCPWVGQSQPASPPHGLEIQK